MVGVQELNRPMTLETTRTYMGVLMVRDFPSPGASIISIFRALIISTMQLFIYSVIGMLQVPSHWIKPPQEIDNFGARVSVMAQ